jgi:GT2 family glycosyltransferase
MSGSNPLVSVVIPAYNAAAYIGDALNAALDQTYRQIEVVVVDDGSSDDTAVQVESFQDDRIRYLRQPNQGQSAAINHGVRESTGDFIKLLDADDWINPQHIEAQLKAIESTAGAVASCRWGYFVDDFTKPVVFAEHCNKDYHDPLGWLIDSCEQDQAMMGGWKWLIPRSIWRRAGGYDPRLGLNNDFHFSIRLLLQSSGVRFAGDAVYSYRKGLAGALSGSQTRAAMESAFLTTDLGTQLLLQREDSPAIRRICADRWQMWLYDFYPGFPDLAAQAEERIESLGGSNLKLQGGRLLRWLQPLLGWKGVRQLQSLVYRCGWRAVLDYKSRQRLAKFQ